MTDRPIMIGGCGSSGTTLLGHLLDQHLTLHCGPELCLLNKKMLYGHPFSYSRAEFQEFLSRRKPVPTIGALALDWRPFSTCAQLLPVDRAFLRDVESYDLTNEMICDLAAQSATFREFVDRLFEPVLLKIGKSRWAEKTPTNCYCIAEFLSIYSNGCYVHVVRDGRDVVISLIKRGWSPEEAVRRWLHDTATGLCHRGDSRYCEVRYEDLVTQPENTLAKLMAFLELDGDPISLFEKARRSSRNRFHASWNVQPHEPISTAAMGKWKQLDDRGKKYFQQLFRYTMLSEEAAQAMHLKRTYGPNDLLAECGYDLCDCWDPDPHPKPRILKHFLVERVCALLHRRNTYCQVSLSSKGQS